MDAPRLAYLTNVNLVVNMIVAALSGIFRGLQAWTVGGNYKLIKNVLIWHHNILILA